MIRKWFAHPFLRWNVLSATRNGVTWQYWQEICLAWRWCIPGYEHFYYDGDYHIVKFGFFSVCYYWSDNYAESHRVHDAR